MSASRICATTRWRVAAALCAACIGGTAIAGSVTLTWNQTLENEDGTPLDLAGFVIYHGMSPDEYSDSASVDGALRAFVWDDLPSGTHYFRATAVNTQGVESEFSNVAMKTLSAVFQVTDTRAYVISQTHNVLTLGQIGTVPLGTPCDETTSVNGKYRVDVEAVSPPVSSQTAIVVAECGFGD